MILEDLAVAELEQEEKKLFQELDKGIDDFEAGRMIPHDEAMRRIREEIKSHAV